MAKNLKTGVLLAAQLFLCAACAANYTLSPVATMYTHEVRDGLTDGAPAGVSHTYTIEVPQGKVAVVSVETISSRQSNCENSSHGMYHNSISCTFPLRLTATTMLVAKATRGDPSVAGVNMWTDSRGMPHFDGYTYYTSYYHSWCYKISVVYASTLSEVCAIVRFDANGGAGSMAPRVYDLNTTYRLPANGFTRDGYWFIGWGRKPEGPVTYAFSLFMLENREYVKWYEYNYLNNKFYFSGDYTFYAIWKKKGFIIEYFYDGDSVRQYCEPGKIAKLMSRKSFYNPRKFVGWKCSNGKIYDDDVLVYNLGRDGETVTMTAIWE